MITSFAYVGFVSPNAADWRTFGPEVLGAQLVDHPEGAVALRVDDRAARLMVHEGEVDDVAYVGWDCGDAVGLADIVQRVRAAGITVVDDSAAAAVRQVEALAAFTDPWGFRHELTHGLAEGGPFQPGRPMNGFLTGGQGLGHLVFLLPDLDDGMRFYTETLGFLLSDHIEMGISLRFLHCNPRHHTLALSAVPGIVGIHHLMLEVNDVDDVGRALDIVNERSIPVAMGLGRHTNDHMTSFYVRTPSGFEIEYGAGGRVIDDATWEVEVYDAMSIWGHKPPAEPLMPGMLRPFAPADQ
ncbi:MAG: VOC family protein [Actinobacteria bacterium]|nr:VOC family protein [Actinomycetota bacterium]